MADHEDVTTPGSTVRRANTERVLDALRASGPSSQAALARRTGLSPATINTIVKTLRHQRIATVVPLNKRESLVSLVAAPQAIMSVQVNVTGVHAALFDFGAESRTDHVVPVEVVGSEGGGDPDLVEAAIRDLATRAGVRVSDLAGVAIGMQGPISRSNGAVFSWARLQLPGWRDVPIAEHLSNSLGVPVIADNDANLAALAEWTWGAGRGAEDFLYVICSSGIGGGIIIDGSIYRGGDGMAGEIGHMVLEQDGPVCFCGSRGCLTTFASERSILATLANSGAERATLQDVIESARRGDPASQRVLFEAGRHLGRALANTAKVIAPSVIAIGGALGAAGSLVFDSLRSSVEINSLRAVSPAIRFRAAQIGGDETLLGGLAAVLTATGQGISALPRWSTSHLPTDD